MCQYCAVPATILRTAARRCTASAPRAQISRQSARRLIHNRPFKPYKGDPMTVAEAAKLSRASAAGVGTVAGSILAAAAVAKFAREATWGLEQRDRNGVLAYLERTGRMVA